MSLEPVTNLEKGPARFRNPSRTWRRDPRVFGTRHETREGTRASLEPVTNLEKGSARLWNPSRTPRRDPRVSGTRHEPGEGTRAHPTSRHQPQTHKKPATPDGFTEIYYKFDSAFVMLGTTCFLRETTPSSIAVFWSSATSNARSTEENSDPNARILELEFRMSVTINVNRS